MVIKECTQIKCCFHKSHGETSLLCPTCSECGAENNQVEMDTCVNCWNCLKDENFIRNGRPDLNKIEQKRKNKSEEKILEVIR